MKTILIIGFITIGLGLILLAYGGILKWIREENVKYKNVPIDIYIYKEKDKIGWFLLIFGAIISALLNGISAVVSLQFKYLLALIAPFISVYFLCISYSMGSILHRFYKANVLSYLFWVQLIYVVIGIIRFIPIIKYLDETTLYYLLIIIGNCIILYSEYLIFKKDFNVIQGKDFERTSELKEFIKRKEKTNI